MTDTEQSVEDAQLLYLYALRAKITVPDAVSDVLRTARTRLDVISCLGSERDAFYDALAKIIAIVPKSISEIRAEMQRMLRLEPQVAAAQRLISYGAANGKQIGDDVRNGIIEVANAVAQGSPTVADEESFFKTYQALTIKLAPVTAATLAASETRVPNPLLLIANPHQLLLDAGSVTLGRFIHFIIFVLVLFGAGLALAYQSIGEAALARYQELQTGIHDLETVILQKQDVVQDKKDALSLSSQKTSNSDASQSADRAFQQVMRDLKTDEAQLAELKTEEGALPAILRRWEERPCAAWLTEWMCLFLDRTDSTAPPNTLSLDVIFSAKAALARMSQIILPMLLGFLGAYSFVLRSMSREILEMSFAPHSSLQHLVRLSLGALAGIASGWLLKPEQVGLLASVPAWTLAFIAGYGTELVFAFMDRLIRAFTSKPA